MCHYSMDKYLDMERSRMFMVMLCEEHYERLMSIKYDGLDTP